MQATSPRTSAPIGDDRLLGIQNIADITGFCPTVTSQLMDETGHVITLHSHKYVLQSSFMEFLRESEGRS
jgi:hypothetical protein